MSQNPLQINEVVPCMSSHYDTTLLAEELYLKVPSETHKGPLRSVFVDAMLQFTIMEQCGPPVFALTAAYADSDPLTVAHYITLLRSPIEGFVEEVRGKLLELVYARERLAGRWSNLWHE